MANKWSLFLIAALFGLVQRTATAQILDSRFIDRAPVKAATLKDQMTGINPFQMDCLSLIKPANKYLDTAETYKTKKTESFLLRLTGKIDKNVKVGFATDFITYKSSNGTERNYNFHLKKIPVMIDAEGQFALSLVLRKGQIFVPLVFESEFQQLYELSLKISDTGKIQEAMLKPIIGEQTRMRLCSRTRFEIGTGFNFMLYEQNISDVGAHLTSSSLESNALNLRYLWSPSSAADHSFQLMSLSGTVKGSRQFQGDIKLSETMIKYHYQKRKFEWNGTWRGAFIQPFVRYGGNAHTFSTLRFVKADQAEATQINFFNGSVGAGVNIMDEDDWMVEASMDLQYPLHSNIKTNYKLMFGGSVGLYSTFNRVYYYGFVWSGAFEQFDYSRSDASLDSSGDVSTLSSNLLFSLGRLF